VDKRNYQTYGSCDSGMLAVVEEEGTRAAALALGGSPDEESLADTTAVGPKKSAQDNSK
jgi:hypothetical protein